MNGAPTRTKLRLGLVSPKSKLGDGVTNEELDELLSHEPSLDDAPQKPARLKKPKPYKGAAREQKT